MSERTEAERQALERMFPGGGQMGERMRALDWSATPLGEVSTWPSELRTLVGMVLANHFPMSLLWGPDLVQLYNDAYIPLIGDKHPWQLGRPCRETWAEVWEHVGPRFQEVLDTGRSRTHQKQLLFLHRYGFPEEGYYTDSFAPLWGSSGRVEGVLITVVEDTERLLSERRLRTLRDLAAETAAVESVLEAQQRISEVLRRNTWDIPFALMYLMDDSAREARLAFEVGLAAGQRGSPPQVWLSEPDPGSWPLEAAGREGGVRVQGLEARFGPLPGGPWPESPREALVLPLQATDSPQPFGFLVVGISPRLRLEPAYEDFLRLLARQVSTLLATVRARQRSEAEQRQAHQRVTGILETLGDSFLAVDPHWRVTLVNSTLERISCQGREQLLGRSLWELWPQLLAPELHFQAEYQRCMHERVPVHFLDYFVHLDSWTETRAHPTPDGGMAIFVRDVGEQKRAEAERDQIFKLSTDLLCVAGFDGYLKRVNPAWTQVLGWSEAELLATPYLQRVHPEDLAASEQYLAALRGGERRARVELRLRHRDGSWRWLSWNTTAEVAKGLLYSVSRDVTEERRVAEDMKGRVDFEQQLIGIVSHDLRNPLSAILLGAQSLLRREGLDANATRAALRILSSAERGARMVRDLLDFTQARLGGQLPIQPAPVDLHALTRHVLDEVQMSFPERPIHLSQQGDGRVEWDEDRVAQLLTNLVTNAVKYSPPGTSVRVTVRGEEEQVLIEVHNGGDPIPTELMSRLFQPLQRGSGQRETTSRSVGLGLYIVKHIVDVHGGHIDVRSTAGEGTCFSVRMPRSPHAKARTDTP